MHKAVYGIFDSLQFIVVPELDEGVEVSWTPTSHEQLSGRERGSTHYRLHAPL